MKILLTEMACNWDRLANDLQNKTLVRVEHMLKLLFYRKVRLNDVVGWCRSVANSCPSYILRTGKKLQWPKLNKYLSAMWDPIAECDETNHLIDKYVSDFEYLGYPKVVCDKSRVKEYLHKFCIEIATVSSECAISVKQVNEIADNLHIEYSSCFNLEQEK